MQTLSQVLRFINARTFIHLHLNVILNGSQPNQIQELCMCGRRLRARSFFGDGYGRSPMKIRKVTKRFLIRLCSMQYIRRTVTGILALCRLKSHLVSTTQLIAFYLKYCFRMGMSPSHAVQKKTFGTAGWWR